MTGGPTYPGVEVHLSTGRNGNVFALIGAVREALRGAGVDPGAFTAAAMAQGSYDEVLRLILATVEVS